ncbi:hypothetical protein H5410_026985 [Solanum commersonii]|uniref:Uncharacterized protein n=1 Tax=Solanum commersonii TaxID=4109 RepID=A0A9J5Z014_SOLCO|nr:hypothetical protein H5410_026985 [Solanum commersonii]
MRYIEVTYPPRALCVKWERKKKEERLVSQVFASTFCHSAHILPTASRRLVFTTAPTSTFLDSAFPLLLNFLCGSQFCSSDFKVNMNRYYNRVN